MKQIEITEIGTPTIVSAMKAFIIYKDFTAAVKATVALNHSMQNPDSSAAWDVRPWWANMLKFPPTTEKSLADAVEADLIVFAGDWFQSMPLWLQDWLERWAKRRQIQDAALAVMCGSGVDSFHKPVAQAISRFAGRHGLRFVDGDEVAAEAMGAPSVRSLPEQQRFTPEFQSSPVIDQPRRSFNRGPDADNCTRIGLPTTPSQIGGDTMSISASEGRGSGWLVCGAAFRAGKFFAKSMRRASSMNSV